MHKYYTLILMIFVCLVSMGFADLSRANKAFLSSDYKGAVEEYKTIVQKGVEDADLFYNLATSYLYMGEYGNAIFWYRKSELLSGSRDDIQRNLKFAAQSLEEQGTVVNEEGPLIYDFVRRYYSPYISIVYIIMVNLFFFLLILRRFLLIRLNIGVVMNILMFFTLLFTIYIGLRFFYVHIQERGVITVKSVDIKEGPSDTYRTLSQISEGMLVVIKEHYGDFLYIQFEGKNLQGWIPVSSVGILKVSSL